MSRRLTARQTVDDCATDIFAAQEYASMQPSCTGEVAHMECPHDADVVYHARNGCEIDYLKGEGWTVVGETPADSLPDLDLPVLGKVDGKSAVVGSSLGIGALWLYGGK